MTNYIAQLKKMNQQFDIQILKLNWITETDDGKDLCAHGKVYLKIGEEVLCHEASGEWTLSSTALYLLRSLEKNYYIDDFASQLIPCCGHFFIANEDEQTVKILGCPNGIDWTIEHVGHHQVKHTTAKGETAIIEKADYKKLVLEFADKVEQFYKKSLPKELPLDEFDKKGYLSFWKEWKDLRRKYYS